MDYAFRIGCFHFSLKCVPFSLKKTPGGGYFTMGLDGDVRQFWVFGLKILGLGYTFTWNFLGLGFTVILKILVMGAE